MKRTLAVHDISCVGRCSLTVALPIISAYGQECAVLPTALLSTHTGGFSGFSYLDLTDEMRKIMAAWRDLNMHFDCVYSGFLGSFEQIDVVKELLTTYKNKACIAVVDPVMADDGKIYKIFDAAFVEKMAELVPYADVLVPNMTEAMLLAGIDYREGAYTKEFVSDLLERLRGKGAKKVVLTGVHFDNAHLGVATMDERGEAEYYFEDRIGGSFHGTGDVFGSALVGSLMQGMSLIDAAAEAVRFVVESIKATPHDIDSKYGVWFESALAKRMSR